MQSNQVHLGVGGSKSNSILGSAESERGEAVLFCVRVAFFCVIFSTDLYPL